VRVSVRQAEKATILDVAGNIDLQSSPEMRKALLDHLKVAGCVIVNLKEVPYIDSSGIASLVEGLKASRDQKKRLVLIGLNRMARDVLNLTRLTPLFEIHETEEQALGA
jgi:anti-sigma B factor antagonist